MKNDVIVIGGGVIGTSCAYELSQRGARVTIIDKGEIGYGCSYGNAGWITPCFALPLPRPGILLKSIVWLFDPDSPLRIKPQLSWHLIRWLLRFVKSMNHRHLHSSIEALVGISLLSQEIYKKLNDQFHGEFEMQNRGLLMVAQTKEGLKDIKDELDWVSPFGVPGQMLSEKEARVLEPALTGAIEGGVLFPNESHAEPLKVVQTLLRAATALGARALNQTEFFDFESENGKLRKIRTTKGWLEADQFILATGTWSFEIGKTLGLRIPLMGGKGYSIITKPLEIQPRLPLMLLEKKIAVTPRANSLRLAGTLELVNSTDETISVRRANNIIKGAREFLSLPNEPAIFETWRGLRPCTPDGNPLIGRSKKLSNLIVATGHQMLGLQSGVGTGRLVAEIAMGNNPSLDISKFDPNRF